MISLPKKSLPSYDILVFKIERLVYKNLHGSFYAISCTQNRTSCIKELARFCRMQCLVHDSVICDLNNLK